MACISHPVVRHLEEDSTTARIDIAEAIALVLGLSPCFLAYGVPLEPTAGAPQAQGVGDRLREARVARGMDKKALGEAAGVTGQAVAHVEQGRSLPNVATAEQLAAALGVSVCWLAYGEGDMAPPPRRNPGPGTGKR